MPDRYRAYRIWFYAAALYNLVWGIGVVLWPEVVLHLTHLPVSVPAPLIQVIGMMVGVYAYGYYLLARDPDRYQGLVWVGIAGKTFGPVGYLLSVTQGTLPMSFGWVVVMNDLIWWPAFWSFALRYARHPLGKTAD